MSNITLQTQQIRAAAALIFAGQKAKLQSQETAAEQACREWEARHGQATEFAMTDTGYYHDLFSGT
jgi:hypothetical protein